MRSKAVRCSGVEGAKCRAGPFSTVAIEVETTVVVPLQYSGH